MPPVIILNATIYEWNRVSSSSDRMKKWTFANDDLGKLPARSGRGYYVEYTNSSHSNASVEYELVGTGRRFGIHAQKVQRGAPNNYTPVVNVTFDFGRLGDPGGSSVQFEWRSDSAAITFLLGGKEGAFYCNPTPHDWMHQTLPTIGHRNFLQICIPGSHDAGMSQAWSKAVTSLCKLRHIVTQYDSMLEQLRSGCRWFDVRPWIVGGRLTTGHYSPLGRLLGWQGGTGQSIRSIVDDVNTFTATNKELVVLYMGHAHNADQDYRQFNQHDWDTVFQETDRLNNLYKVDVKDLTLVTVNEFIKDGAAVLVVVDRGNDISLGDKPWTRGLYRSTQLSCQGFGACGEGNGQLTMKWGSWEQSTVDAIKTFLGGGWSPVDLAECKQPDFFMDRLRECSPDNYPNVLAGDIYSSPFTALAIAVNDIVSSKYV